MAALASGCEALETIESFIQGAAEIFYSLPAILTERYKQKFKLLKEHGTFGRGCGRRLTLGATS